MSSIGKQVLRIQKKLLRMDIEDNKVIKYLSELDRLDVTIDILKATGIGKTVNQFRKHNEEPGDMANALIRKWKALACRSQDTVGIVKTPSSSSSRQMPLLNSYVGQEVDHQDHTSIYCEEKPSDCANSDKSKKKVKSLQLCDVSFGCEVSVRSKHKKRQAVASAEKHINHTSTKRWTQQDLPPLPEVASIADALLPEIQPTYRPMRLPEAPDSPFKRKRGVLEVEDDVGELISSRKSKTQVFSGKKAPATCGVVHSLYETAMRVLMDNIDALQDTGGVPYDILKPLLAKCNPQQLFHVEEYNTYFIDDTGPLWKIHCCRDFKGSEPRGRQKWRDLYMANQQDREERLRKINEKIIAAQAAKKPERQVKLAYVMTEAKPPPQVRRKQAKFGTGQSPHSLQISEPSPGPSRISSHRHSTVSSIPSASPSKKLHAAVAPMMKKTMKMMKVQRNIGSAKIKRK